MKASHQTTTAPTRNDSRLVSILLQISILGVCLATFLSIASQRPMKHQEFSGQRLGFTLDSGETGETKRYVDEAMEDFLKRHADLKAKAEAEAGEVGGEQ